MTEFCDKHGRVFDSMSDLVGEIKDIGFDQEVDDLTSQMQMFGSYENGPLLHCPETEFNELKQLHERLSFLNDVLLNDRPCCLDCQQSYVEQHSQTHYETWISILPCFVTKMNYYRKYFTFVDDVYPVQLRETVREMNALQENLLVEQRPLFILSKGYRFISHLMDIADGVQSKSSFPSDQCPRPAVATESMLL